MDYDLLQLVVATFAQLYSNLFPYPLYIGLCLLLMLIYSVIYFLLAIYIERVNPGEFGVAQSWNYLFKKSYWKPEATSAVAPSGKDCRPVPMSGTARVGNHWVEPELTSSTKDPSLTISHLTKVIFKHFLHLIFTVRISSEIRQVHRSF